MILLKLAKNVQLDLELSAARTLYYADTKTWDGSGAAGRYTVALPAAVHGRIGQRLHGTWSPMCTLTLQLARSALAARS